MKMTKFTLCALALFAFASCNKSDESGESGQQNGKLTVSLNAEENVIDVTRSKVSDLTTLPAVTDFTITIKSASDATQVWTGKLGDMTSNTLTLAAGDYTAEAVYGAADDEGFDKPFFTSATGGVKFTVTGGNTTAVNIPVTLGNAIIKVTATDAFKNYFSDYSFTITTAAGKVVDYAKTETRGVFIDAYKFTIEGTLTNQGGTKQTFKKEYSSLNAATCYDVKFDITTTGGSTITITFDNTTTTVDLSDIELNE